MTLFDIAHRWHLYIIIADKNITPYRQGITNLELFTNIFAATYLSFIWPSPIGPRIAHDIPD
nr:hypothetical protein [Clostridia bacterium]